ncbi:hypothetical protein M0R45_012392 [Rubus argutus]|uniref:Uncharacterized protein n=1 Tax=Rubus argutus TaxID=59490 RepID=A0AAW1YCK9_RUBAR
MRFSVIFKYRRHHLLIDRACGNQIAARSWEDSGSYGIRCLGEDKRRETLEKSDKVLIGGSREWRWVEVEE